MLCVSSVTCVLCVCVCVCIYSLAVLTLWISFINFTFFPVKVRLVHSSEKTQQQHPTLHPSTVNPTPLGGLPLLLLLLPSVFLSVNAARLGSSV